MTTAKIPPKPGKDTVYVDVDDEITSVIDKVEGAKQKVVALVLPKRATVLQSVVNMRLLKRNAEKAGKSVVLITGEEALLPLAGAAGLHVAKNLQSKPGIPDAPTGIKAAKKDTEQLPDDLDAGDEEPATKLDYHRSIGELAASHADDDESEAIDLEDEDAEEPKSKAGKIKKPKDKRLKVPNFDRFRLMLFGGAAAFISLIVFIILAIFVLPKATITVHTQSMPISANLILNASTAVKKLDEAKGDIPAVLQTSKQTSTQRVEATGQQNNGKKATGSVTMAAQKCAPNIGTPNSVPAGTGIGVNGLTFITQANTTFTFDSANGSCVNYRSTSSTSITAQSGGTKYNVSNEDFTVAGRSDVSASGSANGGKDDITTVVSQADLDKAKGTLTSAETDKFTKDFEDQLADKDLYVLTSTLKLNGPTATSSPAVGKPATTATVTIQIVYTVLTVNKSDLTKVISDTLDKQLDKDRQKISDGDLLTGATITVQTQSSPKQVTLNVEISTTAVPIIDMDAIKAQSVGKKTGAIKSAVGDLPGVKSVDVHLSPFWVSKAPKASKIMVIEQQVNSSGG